MLRKLGAFALAAALLAGCATAEKDVMVGESALSRAVAAGYAALDLYDQSKIADLQKQAEGGDVPGAMAQAQTYAPKRAKAIGALDSAEALVEAAESARQGVDAAKGDPKALLSYLPQFVQAAGDIATALSDAGVKLPGALTSALGALGVK